MNGSTQLSVTSPSETMVTEQSGNLLSFETALTSQPGSPLMTANSTQRSCPVNCTISPFDNFRESDLFNENTSQGLQ